MLYLNVVTRVCKNITPEYSDICIQQYNPLKVVTSLYKQCKTEFSDICVQQHNT